MTTGGGAFVPLIVALNLALGVAYASQSFQRLAMIPDVALCVAYGVLLVSLVAYSYLDGFALPSRRPFLGAIATTWCIIQPRCCGYFLGISL